jgi:nitronate monooxygenase
MPEKDRLAPAISTFQTPICGLLGCDYPVVLAGMGGVARSELVATVSEAGGFGFLGMVREPPDLIRREIARVRAVTGRDFGVNLIPAATEPELLEAELDVVIGERVAAVTLFWDLRPDIVSRLRGAGCLVLCQIGSIGEAEEAAAAGAHVLIAQGLEAGGHVRGTAELAALLPEVVARVDLPVLAAGGIVDGQGLAAALRLGAQGVMIGTGFLATRESFAHDYHKNRIVAARPGETVYTHAFHINWPEGAPVRVLPNSVTRGERGNPFSVERRVIGDEAGRPIYLFSTDSPLRTMTGDFEAMALYAGSGADRIDSIPSAAERLEAIVNQATRILSIREKTLSSRTDTVELSSPACWANEADDVYMGYAGKAELAAFLNELLEAERAGERIALRTALAVDNDRIAALLHTIHRDRARWRAMLLRHIRSLGERPSRKLCAVYATAMAVKDIGERIAVLNRAQSCAAEKLRGMLPRIRDDDLRADLADMLRSHESDILLADTATSASS